MAPAWNPDTSSYEFDWGGRRWSLPETGHHLGLKVRERPLGPLLAVDGISARGRGGPTGLGGESLVERAGLFNRVEYLYAPMDWGTLRVRAGWASRSEDVIDLEVQVQAFTVGDLQEVEVEVLSRLGPVNPGGLTGLDASARARVREPGVTLPIRQGPYYPPLLWVLPGPVDGSSYYLEMIHPDDATRREVDRTSGEVRYRLFGHDLERGVVVRGRLRGIWLDHRPDEAEVSSLLEQFLLEPPPLRT